MSAGRPLCSSNRPLVTLLSNLNTLHDSPELETALAAVENQLASLGESLRANDTGAIDRHATELHRALARAVDHFSLAARAGGIPAPLRHRLALAGGLVASQREALARATAALDRAIDVLMPRDASAAVYSTGSVDRGRGGMLQA
jgi:hypothetical protein